MSGKHRKSDRISSQKGKVLPSINYYRALSESRICEQGAHNCKSHTTITEIEYWQKRHFKKCNVMGCKKRGIYFKPMPPNIGKFSAEFFCHLHKKYAVGEVYR